MELPLVSMTVMTLVGMEVMFITVGGMAVGFHDCDCRDVGCGFP